MIFIIVSSVHLFTQIYIYFIPIINFCSWVLLLCRKRRWMTRTDQEVTAYCESRRRLSAHKGRCFLPFLSVIKYKTQRGLKNILSKLYRCRPLVRELWGPVPLPAHVSTTSGSMVTHSIVNHYGNKAYKVTVLHSQEAVMSAVMVTNNDNQLQAAAHLIGTNQLPLPHRVWDFTFMITFMYS